MQRKIIGISLIGFGLFVGFYTIRRHKESDMFSTVRTFSGALIFVLIGVLLLLDKW